MKTIVGNKPWLRFTALAGLALCVAGCAYWRDRVGEQGETRFYEAAVEDVFRAIREELDEHDFRVRHFDADRGRLTALSRLRSESTFRATRQTELDFRVEEGIPGETEVRLRILEIEEHSTAAGPSASRTIVRSSPLYRILFDGISERLGVDAD